MASASELALYEATLKDKKEQVKELENKIQQLQKADIEARQEPFKKLALAWHEYQCHQDHMDRCSWEYEKDWSGWTHKRYLDGVEKACTDLKVEADEAIAFLERLQELETGHSKEAMLLRQLRHNC